VSNASAPRRPGLLILLAALLYLEAAALAGLTLFLILEVVLLRPDSYASALALIVLAALGALWPAIMGTYALRGRPWIRGGTVTWQILQALLGITAIVGGSSLGWVLVAAAVVVLVVLFTRPVVAATQRSPREG
jgi:hypothetical protein